MKTKIIQLVVLCAALLSTGCSDWFDVSPKADVKIEDLFQSESGFRDVLLGGYSLMATPALYGREMSWGFVDILALYYPSINNKSHSYYKAMRHQYDEPEVEKVTSSMWVSSYKAISNLNAILKYIDQKQSVFSSNDSYELMKGETLALRAFLHFDLCRLFGAVPSSENASAQSVPYMTDFTNVAQAPLSMSDFYQAAIRDVEQALELMRDHDLIGPNYAIINQSGKVKPERRKKYLNYYAVCLLKARIANYFGDKNKAMEAVKLIIPTAQSTLPEPLSLASGATDKDRFFKDEQMFVLDMVDLEDKLSPYCGEKAKENGNVSTTILSFSRVAKERFYAKISPNDNDFRLQIWFTDLDGGTDMIAKYKNSTQLPMLHVSELYYIAAECAVSSEEQLAYLNMIRAHRGLAEINETLLKTELDKEWQKEFMGEGESFFYFKRKGAKRMGVFTQKNVTDINRHYQIPYPVTELEYGKITLNN